jgi:DNA-binding response OmpR family regulator
MTNILLVEDDFALAMGIEYALRSEGFEIETAKSVKTAKDLLNNKNYELILLDVMLPDGSGYDLCKDIRKKGQTPIIFLTACDEEANVVMGLDLGGDDYLTKPIRIRELISRINAVLRRKSSTAKEAVKSLLISDDIKVDFLKYRVVKGDKEIILTAAEYKLLIAFMQNGQQVLSRNQIFDMLWDMQGEFVDDNTLSVYIRRLRDKLGDNIKEPKYIQTIRGLGYKWIMDVRSE